MKMLKPLLKVADLSVARLPPKEAEPFYHSPEWRSLRRQALERDYYVCTVKGCYARALTVDHILSRRSGGRDDLSNLRSLCRMHDNQVKENELGERRNRGHFRCD